MGTWNTNYEQLPRNKNNAGYGAPAIRELKSEISARLEQEHFSGPTWETGSYPASIGFHREGSSRVQVTDPFSGDTDRAGSLVTDAKVGRVEVDLDEIDTLRTYNGELEAGSPPAGKFDTTSTSVDQFNQKLKVRAYNDAVGTLVTKELFDAERFVDIKFDQLIDGLKEFNLAPFVTTDGFQEDKAAYPSSHLIRDIAAMSSDELRQLVPLTFVKDSLEKIYQTMLVGESIDSNIQTENTFYVGGKNDQTLKIKAIEADTITGATWNA